MAVTKPVHRDRAIPAKAMLKRDGFRNFDISHASGTSQSTFSNVLNGHSHNADVERAIELLYAKCSRESERGIRPLREADPPFGAVFWRAWRVAMMNQVSGDFHSALQIQDHTCR
jgi:hypothetical protein